MNPRKSSAFLLLSIGLLAITATSAISAGKTTKKNPHITYKQVQAVFDKNCIQCHKGPKPRAMMNLENYAGLMKGNDDGPVITPGHPEKSYLYQLISWTGRKKMPPRQQLAKGDIAMIAAWIKAGAKGK